MRRIEALADALMSYNGYLDPQSSLYQLRNPGGLKAYLARHVKSEEDLRVFERHIDGYKALLNHLEVKCSGRSKSGLQVTSPLVELTRVFGFKDETLRYILKFLRKALGVEVPEHVMIGYFLEE